MKFSRESSCRRRQLDWPLEESATRLTYHGVQEEDAMKMQEVEIYDYARQLLETHGDKAVAEAAQKACALEKQGENEQAETWRHIEAALKLMRGPHVS